MDDPSSPMTDPRMMIAMSRRILGANGCDSTVGGHVSLRVADEEAFWFTPFQYFDETLPSHVAKVGMDLRILEGDMESAPAAHFHAAVYKARPDVNAVLHTHSTWVSVLSTASKLVGMYHDDATILHEDQALMVQDFAPPIPDDLICELLGQDKHILLMKNHGALIAEESLEAATVKALTLERCAQIHVFAELIGGTELPERFVVHSKPAYRRFYMPHMWQANVRRLRRLAPDLFHA